MCTSYLKPSATHMFGRVSFSMLSEIDGAFSEDMYFMHNRETLVLVLPWRNLKIWLTWVVRRKESQLKLDRLSLTIYNIQCTISIRILRKGFFLEIKTVNVLNWWNLKYENFSFLSNIFPYLPFPSLLHHQ